MPDNWFCESCGSMNRGQADRCYHCHLPKSKAAFATARDRRPGDALLPGADKLDPGRAADLLAQHPYIDVSLLAYASAALFTVIMSAGLVVVAGATASVLAVAAPKYFQVTDAMNRLLLVAGGVLTAATMLGLPIHGAFLSLTTRNVPALGGGKPRFEPARAAFWWLETYMWAAWAYCIVWVLPGLFLVVLLLMLGLGAQTLGLFGFFGVAAAIWYWGRHAGLRVDFPQHALEVLRRPARLLEDLTERLAVQVSPGRRLVSLWSTSWVGASLIRFFAPYLILGLYLVILLAFVARAMAGFGIDDLPSENAILRTATLFGLLLALLATVADLLAVFFMTRITLALGDAQRSRRRWLLEAASGKASVAVPEARPAAPTAQPAATRAAPAPLRAAEYRPGGHPLAGPAALPGSAVRPASAPIIGVVRDVGPATAQPRTPAPSEPEAGAGRPTVRPDIPPGR